MDKLHCSDCATTKRVVYPIINNDKVEPLCSNCIVEREKTEAVMAGRTELDSNRIVKNFPYLNVKELKERLKEVPDSTPVAYQRIQDKYFETHGWQSHELAFDYDGHTSEYIIGFSAYWHPDKNVFVINAHY